ncbi:MAG: MBL fold metallo-hydrolase [Lachnospiraceae bacterium]|nr:MBL fold metallo-hydrolase [Lachnospiraceae bacterium]
MIDMSRGDGNEWMKNVLRLPREEYMKKIREGVKRYDVDPYPEVFQLHEHVFSMYVPCTHNHGDVWMHLIEGEDVAMLVDTGFGVGDLRALCRELIGEKPVIVVNTHCHGDHSLGNVQFDRVYCHKYDAPMLLHQQYPEYWEEFNITGPGKIPRYYWKNEDVMPFRKYEIIPCENGKEFSLGKDHTVELIYMPGHTPGGCCYLDKKYRILFSGDALMALANGICNPMKDYFEHKEKGTVAAFRDELRKLQKRLGEIDVLYPGHGILEVPKQLISDDLACAEAICENADCYNMVLDDRGTKKKMMTVGIGNIIYGESRIQGGQ